MWLLPPLGGNMTTTLGHQWRGDYVGNSNESPLPSSQSGTIKRPIKKPKLLLLPSRKRSLSLSLGCQGRPSRKPGLRPHPGRAPPLLQWQGLTRPVITGDIKVSIRLSCFYCYLYTCLHFPTTVSPCHTHTHLPLIIYKLTGFIWKPFTLLRTRKMSTWMGKDHQ